MNIVIKGFNKQQIIAIEQISATINKIPKHHLIGLECIVYDPQRFYQRSYVSPKTINYRASGQYDNSPINYISIYKFNSFDEFTHILHHEIGHHVYTKLLNSFERKQWVTQISSKYAYISDYAKKNAAEDFAECYAYFHLKPEQLKSLSTKYDFIRKFCSEF
ncbi:hypothetical protein [Flocculibacter collagenilyticus]|uniref:hypothetical protein n=1 Tax=Flocculibacter collagenilyticus TaxID=2744479 RepID=UPI0018F6D51F|nr:hypothetical protein [Flocculibacter collagenilyticus]